MSQKEPQYRLLNSLLFLLVYVIFPSPFLFGLDPSFSGGIPPIIRDIKKSVVFFGRPLPKEGVQYFATGFLIQTEKIFHLVTAKHVVFDNNTGQFRDNSAFIFFNKKDGTIGSQSLDLVKSQGFKWVFHPNPGVDIAVIPFPISPDFDVKVIPEEFFFDSSKLCELLEVFFLPFQPNIIQPSRIAPIFRTGMISIVNDDFTFFMDANAFPGNSGSPVFIKPQAIRWASDSFNLGADEMGGKFLGLVGEYVPYQEVAISAQTQRPRIIFEENTGLSKVWTTKYLKEVFQSPDFKSQLASISALIDGKK